MILEGLITSRNADGSTNISPMGPIVNNDLTGFTLRPYQTSRTYRNLKRHPEGVFHVTDDVEMLAHFAVGHEFPATLMRPPELQIDGEVLADACRWYAFRVQQLDDREPRTTIACQIVQSGRLRDFSGFNRAKHAVLEAAILATRTKFLPAEEIEKQFRHLATLVEKTAGDAERRAFEFLRQYVQNEREGEAPPVS